LAIAAEFDRSVKDRPLMPMGRAGSVPSGRRRAVTPSGGDRQRRRLHRVAGR
jgi:hypothetical protein